MVGHCVYQVQVHFNKLEYYGKNNNNFNSI